MANTFKKWFFGKSQGRQLLMIAMLCVGLSFGFKMVTVYDYSLQFWYDQARDAVLSREIILDRDIKIQGPSASGTNDTLYHGVWYYYLIAPWYVVGNGNPMVPTIFIAFLTSLAVGLFVWFTYEISHSLKVASVAGLLAAFSLELAELGVYLANPTMAIPGLIMLYLGIWKIFYQRNMSYKWVILTAFALGWCSQAVLWMIYLWGPVVVGLVWFLFNWNKPPKLSWVSLSKRIIVGLVIYLVCISSILLAQAKLWNAGIFSLSALSETTQQHSINITSHLLAIANFYNNKIEHTLQLGMASFVLIAIFYFDMSKQYDRKTNIFLISLWTAPLWLILWHARYNYNLLMGLEFLIIFTVAHFVLLGKRRQLVIIGCVLIFWLILQFTTLIQHREQRSTTFAMVGAPFLRDQLDLINDAYKEGAPCSYSSLAVPFAYNTTWSYLFDWQSNTTRQPSPQFLGSDQTGIAGGLLVEKTNEVCNDHLTITETDAPLKETYFKSFEDEQKYLAPILILSRNYPGLRLDIRQK